MLLLTRALSGNYVNFGVFALYGDRALSDCLQVTINLCLCISLDEIMSYPKVSKCYFTLLELLMRNHAPMICELDTSVLAHICRSLQEGLKSNPHPNPHPNLHPHPNPYPNPNLSPSRRG